jgi:hypothetical protein
MTPRTRYAEDEPPAEDPIVARIAAEAARDAKNAIAYSRIVDTMLDALLNPPPRRPKP